MITHNVKFSHGHFYLEDGSRIVLSENQHYTITGDEHFFSTHDEMLDTKVPRLPEILKDVLEKEYGKENLIKMLPAGTEFHFNLGLGKRKKGINERIYTFKALLEEDLYLRLKSGKPVEIPESWVVADCITSITDCTSHNFNLEQKVREETIGKAFTMLVSTYFSQQRVTGINIYTRFKTNFKDRNQPYLELIEVVKTFGQIRELVLKENIDEIKKLQEQKKREMAMSKLKGILKQKALDLNSSL